MRFLQSEARYRAFIGGIGSGKSYAGAAASLCAALPGTLGMIVAPTYPMLRDSSLRTFRELAGSLLVEFNASEMRGVMSNGAEVLFRSADAPDRLRGPNASWAWLDEAGQMLRDVWLIVIGRLRQGGRSGHAWATSTPKGFNWLYEQFGPAAVFSSGGQTETFSASTKDNPYLAPDFVHTLTTQYGGSFARQELDGAFVNVDGSVFRRIREAVIDYPEREDGSPGWPLEPYTGTFIAGLDWGQKNDFTVLTVMDAATRRVVDKLRLNKIDWAYQREEIKNVYHKWHLALIVAEANSIGAPNIEALVSDGIEIFPFTTTNTSKSTIIQQLVMDLENGVISLADDANTIAELEAFEGSQTPIGLMKYGAPEGGHDDEVIALALANWGCAYEQSAGIR